MDSKTFQIVNFTFSGIAEQHPGHLINCVALEMMEQCCYAADRITESFDCDIRTSGIDEGDSVAINIELDDPESGLRLCSFTVDRLFIRLV